MQYLSLLRVESYLHSVEIFYLYVFVNFWAFSANLSRSVSFNHNGWQFNQATDDGGYFRVKSAVPSVYSCVEEVMTNFYAFFKKISFFLPRFANLQQNVISHYFVWVGIRDFI